jgi:light-regulated signal transduction histidine kinase (bacteriophytochrome)
MGLLIDDLLVFSRMGRVEMQKTTLNMEPLVKEAIEKLAHDAKGRKVNWKTGSFPQIHGDPAMFRQVFINLLGNALKYSRNQPTTQIEIGCTEKENEVVFFVKDNGVGFDMLYADKLFCVFQRLHSSDEFEGTGIGLANVRRIIQRHGGKTWAEGAVDGGATFYFSMPT